jgi:hypothetical protein
VAQDYRPSLVRSISPRDFSARAGAGASPRSGREIAAGRAASSP